MEKLTPKQREAVADFEALRMRQRSALWKEARSYPGFSIVPAALFLLALGFSIFVSEGERGTTLCLMLAGLIQFHAMGLNRRLNALMELLERDIKRARDGDDE